MTAFGLPQRLIGAGVVCAAALLGLVITEGNARAAGTEVVVAMRPVDPRALLTGHYVLLTFAEAIPPDGACPPQDTAFGQDGWIALSRRGDIHAVTGAAPDRAKAQALGEVTVRGALTCDAPTPARDGLDGTPGMVTMRLAVDRFHADQDEALAIEAALRESAEGADPRVFAILSIGADGTPRTKGLIVDDRRIMLTWF